ncbi:MAG: hypothetical protein DRR08_01195 [Candidatus Parabeggiatoa sp. nov. 2]|nr:MAG: hypothetical protein B6247_01335 [Beggiatoa sp. 4572_84]RKZ64234.1 MAG: hypothetical protein DRR08_01195 [Gammaproteobacteria bacterium]
MHRYLTIFLSSVVLIATLTSAYANTSRLALVIGNADYQGAPLRNPENDANDMANTLKRLGFEVILAQNADQKTMINAVREFEQRLRNGGIGLFYYSGHGVQHANHNYLVPVGADIESEFDIEFETIDASYVLKHMEQANKNGVNIVILDACRNNPFLRRFRNLRRGLARMDSVRGSLIAYATAPGTTAEDGTGRNGTYTKHLLTALRTIPHMSIADLFIEVTAQVEKETHGQQVPWQSLSLTHRFCFAPCGETVRLTQPETSTPYTRPETSIPNTRPETSIPNTRPETSIPYTRPETSIPYTRPVPSVQYTEPEPPVQYLEPDQFIRDYYAAINRREYNQTWSMLSTNFKDQYHCCNYEGNYKQKPYKRWWNSIRRVNVRWAKIRAKNANTATVKARLRYVKKRRGRVVYQTHTFELVSDKRGSWLIDEQD